MNQRPFYAVAFLSVLFLVSQRTHAQFYDTNGAVVQTFAGSGFSGHVDGVGQLTMFDSPMGIVADSQGNLFVWDDGNLRIRKITPDATVSTFAGGGNQSTGTGTNVGFPTLYFRGITIDRNDTIWMITAGELYSITSSADVTHTNFPGVSPSGLCCDSIGNVYFGSGNKVYRYGTNGALTVFVGSGNLGSVDGNGIFTSFNSPVPMTCDSADNIYVWDGNYTIRRVNQNRDVVTIAGAQTTDEDGVGRDADFNSMYGMCSDNFGNIYLACRIAVRKMTATTNVTTLAGSFSTSGYVNGAGNIARFGWAWGVCVSSGTIYVADGNNHRIRSITNNPTAVIVQPANLQLKTYPGLQIVGTVGRTYRVESSPDMTNWTTNATLLLTSSPYLWLDQNPVDQNKFYRAVLLP